MMTCVVSLLLGLPAQAQVPSSWYRMPEDEGAFSSESLKIPGSSPVPSEETLAPVVQKIFQANQTALDQLPDRSTQPEAAGIHPKDWTPWRFTGFATDMGLTTQGLLGILTIRAAAAVQAYWYKQGPVPMPHPLASFEGPQDSLQVSLTDQSVVEDIDLQIEPVVQAAAGSGKVNDISKFRDHLHRTVGELRNMMESIQSRKGSPWWFSKFRFDFFVDGSGNILPSVSAGTELRFRFEWVRLKKVTSLYLASGNDSHHFPSVPSVPSVPSAPLRPSAFRAGLQEFVTSMEQIMEEVAMGDSIGQGFKAYGFRVGAGITASGNIGLARGVGSVLGHIYFSRDAKAPVIRKSILLDEAIKPILMVEENPKPSHVQFARSHGVEVETFKEKQDGAIGQAVYRIAPERLRKGMNKAFKIGSFFAKQANKPNHGSWKVYLIRCGFDASVVGDLGLAAVGGLVSTEVNFYNQDF